MSATSPRKMQSTIAEPWSLPEYPPAVMGANTVQQSTAESRGNNYQKPLSGSSLKFATSVFQFTSKVLAEKWEEIVGRYWLAEQIGCSDIFTGLTGLPQFLRFQNEQVMQRYPFIADLADYELTLMTMTRKREHIAWGKFDRIRIIKQDRSIGPVVNPTLVLRAYEYPVPKLPRRITSKSKRSPVCRPALTVVAIYQDPVSYTTRVQQIGSIAAAMILTAMFEMTPYAVLTEAAIARLSDSYSAELHKQIVETFEELHRLGVFVNSASVTSDAKNSS